MTMLLGYNFGEVGYITADTRGTYPNGKSDDIYQKIEIIKSQQMIVAVAGNAFLGSKICTDLNKNKLQLQKDQLNLYVKSQANKLSKIINGNLSRLSTILLVAKLVGRKIQLTAHFIKFNSSDNKFEILIKNLKKNELVKVGDIGPTSPLEVAKIPQSISKILSEKSYISGIENYLAVTDELFYTAKNLRIASIGGKTMTLKLYIDSNKKFTFQAIRGYKSIIHEPEHFQDVSSYTDLDLVTGNFFLRDMRSEGKIVTHLIKEDGKYFFKYDSCGKEFGRKDFYYTRLIKINKNKALELTY